MSDDALRKVAADATELLRLYDWRKELAARREHISAFDLDMPSHRALYDDLRASNRDTEAAWEQLRTDLQLLAAQPRENT